MKRLVALLLLAAMLIALVSCRDKTADAATQTEGDAVAAIPTDTVTSIAYCDGTVTTRFLYQEDKWIWQDDPTFPLDQTCVEKLVDILVSMGENAPLGVTSDPGAYGLADAVRYLTVADEEGTIHFLLGATAPEGGRYMAVQGDESGSVYLAPTELLDAMATPIYQMALLPSLPQIKVEDMVAMRLSRDVVTYYVHKVDDVWKAGGKEVQGLDDLWEDLSTWTISRCVDYKPAQGVYELCGLDDPLRLELTYINSVGTSVTFTMALGDNGGPEGNEVYVTLGEETTVYALSGEYLNEVLTLARRAML